MAYYAHYHSFTAMIFTLIIGFVLGVVSIIFVLQNTAIVALTFLGWQFHASLAVVLLLALAVGVIITALVSIPGLIRDGLTIRRLRKDAQQLSDEVAIQDAEAAKADDRINVLEQQLAAVTGVPVARPE